MDRTKMTPNESELELAEKIAERLRYNLLKHQGGWGIRKAMIRSIILDVILQHNRTPIEGDECKVDQ